MEAWARWARMNTTLYNDESTTTQIMSDFATDDRYRKDKIRSVERFFKIIASHDDPRVRGLADVVAHPETGEAIYRLVVLVAGIPTQAKKIMLNSCFVIYTINLVMVSKVDGRLLDKLRLNTLSKEEKAKIQYEPSSLSTKYKHVFAWLHEHGVSFQCRQFKSMQGSFHAALKQKFQETIEQRSEYGKRKPAVVDSQAQSKIRDPSNGLQPFNMSMAKDPPNGYNDSIRILCHEFGVAFGSRGRKEPSKVRLSSFEYYVEDKVQSRLGFKCLRLRGFKGADKTSKLSLANPYQFEVGGYLKIWENPNDPFCLVKLFHHHRTKHLEPAAEFYGIKDPYFFMRRAPFKELKVSHYRLT